MTDETDADLFIEAQDTVWESVVAELTAGRKTGHWMWFVFPQLASLGRSDMAQLFGLHDLAEARAYLGHPVLRDRLVTASTLVLGHAGKGPAQIFGSVDALKLKSCMTLFAAVPNAPQVFTRVLDDLFDGERCTETLRSIA
jgi:uncharacterized protein (DUF1810 family)